MSKILTPIKFEHIADKIMALGYSIAK